MPKLHQDLISVLQISYDSHDTDIASVVGNSLKNRNDSPKQNHQTTRTMIDFLFINHDKDAYKSDLCKLKASGMICRDTKVVADNVSFACIDDYMRYVQEREKEGIVKTRTIPCHVEYSGDSNVQLGEHLQPYQDGVGKLFKDDFFSVHNSFFLSIFTNSLHFLY